MDDNSTTGSIFSKLRERLRKIRIARLKKKIKKDEETKEFINETIKNIKRVVEKDNSKTYTINRKRKFKKAISPIPQKKKSLATSEKKIIDEQSTKKNEIAQNNNSNPKPQNTNDKDFVDNVITRIKETRKDREYIRKKGIASSKNKDKITNIEEKNGIQKNSLEKEKAKDELRTKIIYKIKKEFNRSIDEIEILEAKLYDLREQNNEEIELEKAEKIKEEINETIKKINEIIENYNIYRENYNFEDIIYLDDKTLVDDIIDYKNLTQNDIYNKNLIKDYKLLEEYKILYQKLDRIKSITEDLKEENKEKLYNLEEQKSNYNQIKDDVDTLNTTIEYCNNEIDKQNDYFENLLNKIDIINKEEYTTYQMGTLSNIISDTLNFIATIKISPLMGLVPSIFINTFAANLLLRNIYNNFHVEKINKVKYSAINYDSEILTKMSDIDFTANLIDDTIYTISNIKEKFSMQYNSAIPGYEETMKKINDIMEKMVSNKNKMEIIEKNLKESRKINGEKIRKLEKLNME